MYLYACHLSPRQRFEWNSAIHRSSLCPPTREPIWPSSMKANTHSQQTLRRLPSERGVTPYECILCQTTLSALLVAYIDRSIFTLSRAHSETIGSKGGRVRFERFWRHTRPPFLIDSIEVFIDDMFCSRQHEQNSIYTSFIELKASSTVTALRGESIAKSNLRQRRLSSFS